jgi:23S rRNA pseudouridine2605 synthase
MIRSGRVRLNGTLKRDPQASVYLGRDRIEVDDSLVRPEAKVYLMLNKPRGLVTTASDEKGRPTVYSSLDNDLPWVAPVGRLDKASEGMLLLTNDSQWAARVLAPESHLLKTYHVQVSGVRDLELANALRKGLRVSNDDFLRVKDAHILRQGNRNTWLAIALDAGRNRHIRRMLEQLGISVLRLVRVSIGPLTLGDLAKGAFRKLTAEEKSAIDAAIPSSASGRA